MRKFFQSGGAFMLVALLCIGAALLSDHKGTLVGIGAFWLIMAIIVRGNYARKQQPTESDGEDDSSQQFGQANAQPTCKPPGSRTRS